MSGDETEATRLAPGFLVSVPQLADPNFERAVVYLVAHGDEGAFGLTVNRPSALTIPEVCAEFGFTPDRDDDVFQGGPVDTNRGFLLHTGHEALQGAETVEPGIHISGVPETLKTACEQAAVFRLFLGYAGWAPGQLDSEISQGAWLALNSDARYIFDSNPDEIWSKLLQDAGFDPATIGMAGSDAAN